MSTKITFFGGAKIVTGANYLLQAGGLNILVDCGLFQGSRYSEELNYENFSYDPKSIDYVFVTHSHMDHIGRLPKLYKDGFRGTVFASEPTKAIMEVAFPDALDKIKSEARDSGHEPLYAGSDIQGLLSLVRTAEYKEKISLGDNVSAELHDAGHILGSSTVLITVKEDGRDKKLLFSGDIGNPPVPLLDEIDYIRDVDYIIFESAYGSRIHKDKAECIAEIEKIIDETIAAGGVLMIPSFAVERTQELLFQLDEFIKNRQIANVPIFLDSPLAIKITKVYEKFFRYFKPETVRILERRGGLFKFDWLSITPTTEDSKKINDTPAPKIIIAGSGMSQGGRILHHERRYLSGNKNTILFVGYQVAGSLGRRILEGEKEVSIMGERVPVRCRVAAIGGFSAHADQKGLLKLVATANEGRGVKKAFAVQGEEESALAVVNKIKSDLNIDATVPDIGQTFDL